jgi:hypothetical protein
MINKDNPTGTNFTNAEQTNKKNPGAKPNITMLSAEGVALANKTAPASAYDTRISQSAVDKAMRGGK